MRKKWEPESLLAPYRALDLTNEKGLLCGKLLGDMGADVIKIERPGGDPARNIGPFYHDEVDPEKSLFWFASNLNKRGITLNIETDDGRDIFKRLVKSADFVIESFTPGYLEGLGLDYNSLKAVNPGIIMVSITPFGQTGPYAHYKAPDIVGMAMGGMMYICGDLDRPPVRITFPQAYLFASADGVVGAMAALYHRGATGEGQWVDVSMQQGVVGLGMTAPAIWEIQKIIQKRGGSVRVTQRRLPDGTIKSTRSRSVWPTKDGYVEASIMGGPIGGSSSQALVEAMDNAGMAPAELKQKDWNALDMQTITQEELDSMAEPIGRYFATHTSLEIYEEAVNRRIILAPLSTTKQLWENPQLRDRGAWVEVTHRELGTSVTYPGVWARMTETPLGLRRRAPLIGEHNREIYEGELQISKQRLACLRSWGVI